MYACMYACLSLHPFLSNRLRGALAHAHICKINARPRRYDNNVIFAPMPPKFKVEKKTWS